MQSNTKSISRVTVEIQMVVSTLENLQAVNGENLSTFLDNHPDITNESDISKCFKASRKFVLDKLQRCIQDRFDNFLQKNILKAMFIVDPADWPNQEAEVEIDLYGNDEIKTLMAHFNDILTDNGCDLEEILLEWNIEVAEKRHKKKSSKTETCRVVETCNTKQK